MKKADRVRTLIADDSLAVRKSLIALLEGDERFDVVGIAKNGREAVARVDELVPDLVLMDIQMPNMSGLDATASIRRSHPRVRVIVITMHDGEHVRAACAHVGAHGFISKIGSRAQILREIHRILGDDLEGS